MSMSASIIAELVYLCVIGVLILLGNALVILAYVKGPRTLRTITNYFVVNLAVSDFLVGCISVPFWICVILELTEEGEANYKYLLSLDILFGTTSILCLTVVSLERMFAVKYPTRHFNLTRKPVYVAIAATWITGVFLTAVNFLFNGENGAKKYTVFILIVAFLIPLAVIIINYVIIFHTARNLVTASNQTAGTLSRELRVAKTISVIIGLFVVCWMPFFVVNILFLFCTDYCHKINNLPWLVNVSKLLHYSNSMMNFFVYAVRSPDFRETFKALVFNKCNAATTRERLRAFSFSERKSRTGLLKVSHSTNGNDPTSVFRNSTHSTLTQDTVLTSSNQRLEEDRLLHECKPEINQVP